MTSKSFPVKFYLDKILHLDLDLDLFSLKGQQTKTGHRQTDTFPFIQCDTNKM